MTAARAITASGWLLVCGISLACVTEAIAGTVLTFGRADLIGDTHATPDELAWLDICYLSLKLIGFATTPWLLRRFAPRHCLLAATLVMGAACGLAALTANLEALIVLRAAQGFAGAVLLVGGQAMIFWGFPLPRQPVLQAVFAIGSVVAPATLAPALQGWLLDSQSWTWIFFSVVPVSLAAAGLILTSDPVWAHPGKPRRLDGPGLALLGAALFGLTYVLTQGSRWDWFEADWILWLSLLAGAGLLGLALRQRQAASRALLDLKVFGTDDFTFAFGVSFVAGAALFGSAFLIPSFAVSVLGFTPTDAGQLLLPSSLLFVGALLLAALLMQKRRLPPIATVPFGILLIMAAMWLLSGSTGQSGADDVMLAVMLRGLGLGLLFLSITLIAFGKLSPTRIPMGIALFDIGRQLGGLMGVAGLQTAIDHQLQASQAVLAAALNPGSPAVAERLAALTAMLVARGMDEGPAARAATAMLGRTLSGQSAVIAFDSAFTIVALLFVVAAPVLILGKILLARAAKNRAAQAAMAGA